jgi:hypothetical protein
MSPTLFPSSLVLPRLGTHVRHGSLSTGVQLATRGRRDMSARIRDVVLSLALCHNVSSILFFATRLPHDE